MLSNTVPTVCKEILCRLIHPLCYRYERNWEGEEKEARRKKRKLHKQRLGMTFCSDSTFSTYCDTRAFFLTPVRSKTKNKVDFRSVCKIL